MAKELLKLTATEIFFLRWLRENGGSGASSGNNWIGAVDRLVKAGYVKEQAYSFSLDTVQYTLTERGRHTLDGAAQKRTSGLP
jgi:hypothetical protein